MRRLNSTDRGTAPDGTATDPDAPLWQRFVMAADTEAFGELFRRHERGVLTLTLHLLGDREEAEDVKQEAFLRVYTTAHQFQGQCSFKTWLYRIARNLCLSALRRRQRRPEVDDLEATGEALPEEHPEANPEAHVLRRELAQRVQAALAALPSHHRELIVLRDIQDLSYAEIAAVLKCSDNAVKVRLHRAREALRRELEGYLGE